jgi:hypothetical protein
VLRFRLTDFGVVAEWTGNLGIGRHRGSNAMIDEPVGEPKHMVAGRCLIKAVFAIYR